MLAIETHNLSKTYRTRVKAEGLGASFRALVRPDWRDIEAVRDINLCVEQGEILALIGPNGAGKSKAKGTGKKPPVPLVLCRLALSAPLPHRACA